MHLFLSVNPTEAEGLIKSLGVRHRGCARVFLVDAQPDAFRLAVVGGKPATEIKRRTDSLE
jgi:hypothetical protein